MCLTFRKICFTLQRKWQKTNCKKQIKTTNCTNFTNRYWYFYVDDMFYFG
jgi:hypothetical protein